MADYLETQVSDENFSKHDFTFANGEPSCVLGHATVCFPDAPFKLGRHPLNTSLRAYIRDLDGKIMYHWDPRILEFFGLNSPQACNLFGRYPLMNRMACVEYLRRLAKNGQPEPVS